MGPLSQRDLQDAFESVVGQLPVEDASVMLQRLPSLGRIGAESSDRQFVDMFILDGLRAKDIYHSIDKDEASKIKILDDDWINPLLPLGQEILSNDMKGKIENFRQVAKRASISSNKTLCSDIISAMARFEGEEIDLHGIHIKEGRFSEFSIQNKVICNLTIEDSTFDRIILPNSPPKNLNIIGSIAGRVSGAASYSGLPNWAKISLVDEFDSVQTTAQIKKAGLKPGHEILVAVLKKTFKQKGGGRKEEALLRGFGGGANKKIASLVINLLLREQILTRHKGDEGWVYVPNRNETARISALLDQLRSSNDNLWAAVEGFHNS